MGLNELYLRSFRNYGEERLEFAPGVNLIVGQNAQGKTNLLEAIAFLGSGKSFRALKNAEMIGFSAPFCELEGKITAQERQQSIRWLLFPTRQPRQLQIGDPYRRVPMCNRFPLFRDGKWSALFLLPLVHFCQCEI